MIKANDIGPFSADNTLSSQNVEVLSTNGCRVVITKLVNIFLKKRKNSRDKTAAIIFAIGPNWGLFQLPGFTLKLLTH